MKAFLKIMFASMFGFGLGILILFLVFAGALSGGEKESKLLKENSILQLTLEGDLPDRASNDPFVNFSPITFGVKTGKSIGLFELKKIIAHAKADKKIKGIYLNAEGLSASTASLEEVRKSLLDFKTSGKFIISYANNLSQGPYMLNSTADKVYLNPNGLMEFLGFSGEVMFFTGLFEKLNIEPMIFYAGEFKSATEPYRLKQMSEENKIQMSALIEDVYANYLSNISQNRKIDTALLRSYAASMAIKNAKDALRLKMVDGLKYEDQVLDELKRKTGVKEDKEPAIISLAEYSNHVKDKKNKSKNKIAVLYAEGEIIDGEGTDGVIGSTSFVESLRKIRKDKAVKALVIRVNSPGGSGYASDLIWREIELIKSEKKIPVIVSMGSLAASGGYYIAAPADTIVAERNTFTGSIGVFAMMFNTEEAFKNKAGITFDRIKTTPYADFGNMNREWSEVEKDVMTGIIREFYTQFLLRVSKGRNMDTIAVDKVARGRVWTGQDALEVGLVDVLGNFDNAVEIAAKSAGLKEYKLEEFPEQKSYIESMMEDLTTAQTEKSIKKQLGILYPYIKELKKIESMQGIQARLPYMINLK